MASESPQMENSPPRASPSDLNGTPGTDTTKRKAEQSNGTHTRAKRNRYISIACNECKRRKIKCNGQVPCQRCGHLNLECRYAPNCCNNNFKDSEEFRSMNSQITTLQDQVNNLFNSLNDLRNQKPAFDSPTFDLCRDDSQSVFPSMPKARSRPPPFQGPTSSAFNFNVAKSSLQTMGIHHPEDMADELTTAHVTPSGSPPPHISFLSHPIQTHPTKDPIWTIRRDEAFRLCKVYEEEIGIMYPIVDITAVANQANLLYTFMEAATRTGFAQNSLPGADSLNDDSSVLLKLIVATTLVVEGGGQSDLGKRLFLSVKPVIESKLWEPQSLKNIQLFAVVATYHFHTDDDVMAYRLIGLAARMCLELGLHRRDALVKLFPNESQWKEVSRIFWSVYSLERRWALGSGLPFILQDEDIDPTIPEPDDSLLYLRCMISYNRICSKIWYSGLGSESTTEARRDGNGYLDYQILQWYKQVPHELKFFSVEALIEGDTTSRGVKRLRVLLYLRMNQLRILIYRPVLHSASHIADERSQAQTVVDVAKDTVRVLTRLNQMSDIYRTQQITFNHFLVTALGVLLLAVIHAPSDFNRQVRDEFFMALDLINGFSTKSYVSRRLWKTIKGLRKTGEKLGLLTKHFGTDSNDPHSTAAVAMAGLAGHSIDDLSMYESIVEGNELGKSPLNGLQMSHELTNLFEAVGSFGTFTPSGTDSMNGFIDGEIQNTGEVLSGILGGEEEFSRIIRNMF